MWIPFVALSPLDFFLWGYVKDEVYKTPVPNMEILRERIMEAIHTVTGDMLGVTWQEIDRRLNVLRATKGSHIEVL